MRFRLRIVLFRLSAVGYQGLLHRARIFSAGSSDCELLMWNSSPDGRFVDRDAVLCTVAAINEHFR
jgi:hypothetical protein